MKKKLSKTKKIILLGASMGILTAIVTPITIINVNENNQEKQNKKNEEKIKKIKEKIKKIKEKIIDKDILIAPNVSTQNQSEIQIAIRNQLQKENSLLSNNDLLKISTNLSSLGIGVKTQVILTISIDSISSTLSIDIEKANLLKGSNIVDGYLGRIFQDKFKNLWAMGKDQKLQVLRVNQNGDGYDETTGWTDDNSGLTKGSNILSGNSGVIFQDEFKNLWIMGIRTPLQVLRVNEDSDGYDEATGWTSANNSGLTKGSNITDGYLGAIFQDKFKNLWTISPGKKLQVLRVNEDGDGYDETTGWTSANNSGLTNGSNITDGQQGAIFQDKFKNLWSMGSYTSLQVLKVNEDGDGYVNSWTNDNSEDGEALLKGSNITDGGTGVIFQDEFKNLWSMGYGKPLQVLKVNENNDGYDEAIGWTSANNSGLTNGSNINRHYYGTIFQDKFKNLWSTAYARPIQVLKVNEDGDGYVDSWTNDNSEDGEALLKGSNITNGHSGVIFQDEFKNLWSTADKKSLQVLKVNENNDGYDEATGWTNANNSGLTNGLNIDNGKSAVIFQDEFKNLWLMAAPITKTLEDGTKEIIYTKLQVLKANQNGDGYVNSWQKPSD